MTNDVLIGQVSLRRDAKLHLAINGLAHCGAGNGRILADTTRGITPEDRPSICGRCFHAIRIAVAETRQDIVYAATYRPAADRWFERVAESLATDAELADQRELAARYWAA